MSKSARHIFQFVAGHLVLDFANTVSGKRGGVFKDYLATFDDLLAFGQQSEILSPSRMHASSLMAAIRPGEAAIAHARAIALREAIYRIFSRIAHGALPGKDDISLLNREFSEAMSHSCVLMHKMTFRWDWVCDDSSLNQVLWAIARAAGELLTSQDAVQMIRECNSATCGWLFIDKTKNHSRRWCSMKDCGNLAKVRRHRKRMRAQL